MQPARFPSSPLPPLQWLQHYDRKAVGATRAGLATTAVTLTLLVGLMLLAARLLRIGFLASFISNPVLTGFKAGFLRDVLAILGALPAALVARYESRSRDSYR